MSLQFSSGRQATIFRDREALASAARAFLSEARADDEKVLRRQVKRLRREAKVAGLKAEVDKPRAKRPHEAREQSVYVIGVPGGPIKIGISSNVGKRLVALQTSTPDRLKLYLATDVLGPGRAKIVEAECHAALSSRRLAGEWFDVEWREAVSLVKSLTV